MSRNRRSVSALSAGAYTTTFALDGRYSRVKEGGRAPPSTPGWADFTTMMECTPEVAIVSLFVLSTLWFQPFPMQIRLPGTPVSADLINICMYDLWLYESPFYTMLEVRIF